MNRVSLCFFTDSEELRTKIELTTPSKQNEISDALIHFGLFLDQTWDGLSY